MLCPLGGGGRGAGRLIGCRFANRVDSVNAARLAFGLRGEYACVWGRVGVWFLLCWATVL